MFSANGSVEALVAVSTVLGFIVVDAASTAMA